MNHTIYADAHISGGSQVMQRYNWLTAHVIQVIRDRFLAKANDCNDSAEACEFNGDKNSARNWRLQRDAWRAKADEALGGWKVTQDQLQMLRIIEQKQAHASLLIGDANSGLQEALRFEKKDQEKRCRAELAKLEPEAQKLCAEWKAEMHRLRIPIMGDEAEMKALGWWEPLQKAVAARRGFRL